MTKNQANLPLFIEFGTDSWHLLRGADGIDLPVDRLENGHLTTACKESLQAALLRFSMGPPGGEGAVYCGIPARGVSWRRLILPRCSPQDLPGILKLQIESEFPVHPDHLAWGWRTIPPTGIKESGRSQEILVLAIKKSALDEFLEMLGARPGLVQFSLSGLARFEMISPVSGSCAILDVGKHDAEIVAFQDAVPELIRNLSWGSDRVVSALQEELGSARSEAEETLARLAEELDGPQAARIDSALSKALILLADQIRRICSSKVIYLTGQSSREIAPELGQYLGPGFECRWMDLAMGPGKTAATLSLQKLEGGEPGFISLKTESPTPVRKIKKTAHLPVKWMVLAAVLMLLVVVLPFLEAGLRTPTLRRSLETVRSKGPVLSAIDRQYGFLQNLKKNQSPYLDAIYLLAQSAPQGTKFESITMNRRGDLAFRGVMKDVNQVAEFRSKLIDSGFFSTVAFDEQTTSADRQKITVRGTAQWKPSSSRKAVSSPSPGTNAVGTNLLKTSAIGSKTNQPANTNIPATNAVLPPVIEGKR